jgi:hypothetical protein
LCNQYYHYKFPPATARFLQHGRNVPILVEGRNAMGFRAYQEEA